MASVCLYLHVHQPYRVKRYRFFDITKDHNYFETEEDRLDNKKILLKVAQKSYLPTNAVLLKLLKRHPEFRVSFSITGTVLEQFQEYAPEVLESFQELVKTGRVEIIAETYYHSLAFLYSREEFRRQVKMHAKIVKELFDYEPKVFRNTELIYSNEVAHEVEHMGYKGILAEGADFILGWRSPNFVYRPKGTKRIRLLVKNYKLSDDIAFRFSNKAWKEYPLTAPKFTKWINQVNGNGELVNLFMDYETFGEHQWEDTGIFKFLEHMPKYILQHPDNDFVTPSEAIERYPERGELDYPHYVSWADTERDLSAWLSNPIQFDAMKHIFALENDVLKTNDKKIIDDWRKLTTSDHFYYMCTKWFSDGDVHKYFSPYESPYEAFISFMNAMQDLRLRVANNAKKSYS
ncbi:MAG: glycoside hydrolase family 57 protein [Patescibacteria group bacterium]|nr:glycoside hydrolase family 57 protein [Patescibacteria group bacterium]